MSDSVISVLIISLISAGLVFYFGLTVWMVQKIRLVSEVVRKRNPDFLFLKGLLSFFSVFLLALCLPSVSFITANTPCFVFLWALYLILPLWVAAQLIASLHLLYLHIVNNSNPAFITKQSPTINVNSALEYSSSSLASYLDAAIVKFTLMIYVLFKAGFSKTPEIKELSLEASYVSSRSKENVSDIVRSKENISDPFRSRGNNDGVKYLDIKGFTDRDLKIMSIFFCSLNIVIVTGIHLLDSEVSIIPPKLGNPTCAIAPYIPLMIQVGLYMLALLVLLFATRQRASVVCPPGDGIDWIRFLEQN